MSTRSPTRKKSNKNQENESGTVESASQNGQPLDQLVLPWVTRDCLLNSLNQFSQILFRASVPVDMKEKALEKTNGLLRMLISLTAGDLQTTDDQGPSKKMRIDKSGESKAITGTRFFEISSKLKIELVEQLNRNLTSILCEVSSDEEKNRIYEQNNNLSTKLLSLPFKTMNRAPDQFDPFEQPSNISLNSLEIANLKTESADLRENMQPIVAPLRDKYVEISKKIGKCEPGQLSTVSDDSSMAVQSDRQATSMNAVPVEFNEQGDKSGNSDKETNNQHKIEFDESGHVVVGQLRSGDNCRTMNDDEQIADDLHGATVTATCSREQPLNFKTHSALIFKQRFGLNSIGSKSFSLRCPYNKSSMGPRNKCDAFVRLPAITQRIKNSYRVLTFQKSITEFKGHNASCKLSSEVKTEKNTNLQDLFEQQMSAVGNESAIQRLAEFLNRATRKNRVPYVRLNEEVLTKIENQTEVEEVEFIQFFRN